jgi:hypothetical protein
LFRQLIEKLPGSRECSAPVSQGCFDGTRPFFRIDEKSASCENYERGSGWFAQVLDEQLP